MKILLLCNKSPWPPKEGGPIAMNAMAEGLMAAGHTVRIIAINSNKYSVDPASIPEDYRAKTKIQLVDIDLRIRPFPALKCMLSNRSYHVARFITKGFSEILEQTLKAETFDIIQFETLFTTPYISLIRSLSKARLVLRAHNIEHLIWERMASGSRNPLKKFYLRHLARTLREYELSTLQSVDGIAAITGHDADWFRMQTPGLPVTDIPFGINPGNKDEAVHPLPQKLTLFHLGSMNWLPNLEGINWFIENVWPGVYARHPELEFRLAGRAMPPGIAQLKIPGLVVDGEVEDAGAYMRDNWIMIVPLFSGSGIRIKIIEGMLEGKTILTTPVGAEGIQYTDGRDILICRNAEEYSAAIDRCLSNRQLVDTIGRNARELVVKSHNNNELMKRLTEFYSAL